MNLPINERFTSVQKDDLKAALGRCGDVTERAELSSYVMRSLRDELTDEGAAYGLTAQQVNNIVEAVETYVIEGPADTDFATDEAVQAVEDFLCI